MEYSSTQANNLMIFAGLLAFVLGKFGVEIAQNEVVEMLTAILAFIGLVSNWFKRYNRGDVTLGGFRK